MRRVNICLVCCLLALSVHAQTERTASTEKFLWGAQIGLFGIWGHSEIKLTKPIALRIEMGMNALLFDLNSRGANGFVMLPVITAEPKWYYNLNKRAFQLRDISSNSGNFISLKIEYSPNWFYISNIKDLKPLSAISIIPTWGMRRNIGEHFNYEAGIGLGYAYVFDNNSNLSQETGELLPKLHFQIGYKFKSVSKK